MSRKKHTTFAEDLDSPDGRAELMRNVLQMAKDIYTPGKPIPDITLIAAAYADPEINKAILLLYDIVKSLDAPRRAEGMQALSALTSRLMTALPVKLETDIITRRRTSTGGAARRDIGESESTRVLAALAAGKDPAKSERQVRRIKARAKK